MPIQCPLNIERLSTEQFRSLDYAVMGQMYESQNTIGRLADEQVYRADVAQRLESVHLSSQEETPIEITHKTFAKTLYLDLVVSCKGVYELKTVSALNSHHVSQLLTYLYLLDLPRGKLVNFRSPTVESQFVNAPIPREERCGFSVSEEEFRGDRVLPNLVVELVRDWGTSLSASLYQQAIVHLLGGPESVDRMLTLNRDGRHIGNQRFHLIDSDTAMELTAFAKSENGYAGQLKKLLNLSPLQCTQWVNIGPHRITFKTIGRA